MADNQRAAYFDQIYESGAYREYWHCSQPSPELVALVAGGVATPGTRALDIGCGSGTESIFLAQCGYETLGLDISAEAIAIARATAAELVGDGRDASTEASSEGGSRPPLSIEFRVGDVTAMDVPDEAFEFVNDRGVFHLFERARRAACAREIARILTPGGAVALRGSRTDGIDGKPYKALTAESIDEHFPTTLFSRGPVVPIAILSDKHSMAGNMVVLRKRHRPMRTDGGVQIEGIGGVFFKSADPKALQAWYERHLGVPVDENGYVNFRWRPVHDPARRAQTVWSAFKSDTKYFAPSEANHMLNYRVADLDSALARLRADGVRVMDDVEDSEYGKFGWCLDPEGNKIELWQPPA